MSVEKCILCESSDNDLRSDHIREVYKINKDKLCNSQYHPRLFQDEMSKLISGSNPVCNNRVKCRERQRNKNK